MGEVDISTRREFLRNGLTLVGVSSTVPVFLRHSALAVAAEPVRARRGSGPGRILVVVQLAGGNDGLNTVIPIENDLYRKHRPKLAIDGKIALKLNDDYALHPALKGLKALYDDGMVGIVHGVGYPNPNRSHFKSMDIWHTASPDGRMHTGWIGRYFDNTCAGEQRCDPESGIALMNDAPPAMLGTRFQPVAFERPENLSWTGDQGSKRPGIRAMGGRPDSDLNESFERMNQPGRSGSSSSELSFLQRTAMDARLSAADIRDAAGEGPARAYPADRLAGSLRTVARMIAAGMPTRIYYLSQGGYDTHSAQAGRHQGLLQQFGDAMKAFVDDLRASKNLDRVIIMTFSEFGRRVRENASGGTDHGEAAPMFVVGPHVQPGLVGKPCGLTEETLHRGDLAWTTDFRQVYAAVLQQWLGADSRSVLGGDFDPAPVLRKV